MKTILTPVLAVIFIVLSMQGHGQSPYLFNYQGIARDVKGNPLIKQDLSLHISILPGLDATEAEYIELQFVHTNEFGLYTLQIGNGKALTGTMQTVSWEKGNKYIKVAIDPTGGENFLDAGSSQLLSVPYALYAERSGNEDKDGKTRTGNVNTNATHVAGDINYLSKFTALNVIGKSQLFDNGASIGIGTASPAAGAKMHILTTSGNTEHLRMQNTNSTGFGKFMLYNDVAANYATFTKYGSAYPGGYTGIASQYPYANMLAFGNNGGTFLLSNSGNVGINIVSDGISTLKFNAQQNTGYVGIGGNALPSAKIHFNTSTTNDTIKFTNSGTGHLSSDGTEIRTSGNITRFINRENGSLILGTNNTDRLNIDAGGNIGIGTAAPAAKIDIAGQIKVQGGNPGEGKVLTSDANGLGSWQYTIPNGVNQGDILYWNGTQWMTLPVGQPGQFLQLNANGLPAWTGIVVNLLTSAVGSLDSARAVVGGVILADGGAPISARGICYSQNNNPNIQNANVLNIGSGIGNFSDTITGLVQNTKYYYKAFASNAIGTYYGNLDSFTTTAILPLVNGLTLNFAHDDTARSTFNLQANGYPLTAKGIVYSTSPNPTLANNVISAPNQNIATTTLSWNNLTPMTKYYARAYATNMNGTAYSNQIEFTTFVLGAVYGGGMIVRFGIPNSQYNSALDYQHGLIVALQDLNSAEWGCSGTPIVGVGGNSYDGKVNTDTIVTQCLAPNCAARICHDLVLNGFDDWFLPGGYVNGSSEMYHIAQFNIANNNILNFVNASPYWSSNAMNNNDAYASNYFPSFSWGATNKNSVFLIRPVRRF